MKNDGIRKHINLDEYFRKMQEEKAMYDKIKRYYPIIKKLANSEIEEKGIKPAVAVDLVLNSKGFKSFYPELSKDEKLLRAVRKNLLNDYFRQNKKEAEEEER